MTPEQVRTMILDAVRYPLAYRVAVRFHLAEVTRPQFQEAMKSFGFGFDKYKSFGKEVWQIMRDIRNREYQVSDRLKALAEEIALP